MPEMRVLAVRQPWASLIVEGLKTIEVRSKPTNIRGKVAIYSTLGIRDIIEEGYGEYNFYDLPRGYILGTVELTDCAWFDLISHNGKDLLSKASSLPRSKINTDLYYWKLKNPVKFSQPISYKPPKGAVIWSKTELPEGIQ